MCPKWGSAGELRHRRTTSGDQNRQPDPGSLSPLLAEIPLRETTTGKPNPQPNPNAQEETSPPPYATTLGLGGTLSRETTIRGPNPPPDSNTHENTLPTPYATLSHHGTLPPQGTIPGGLSPPTSNATLGPRGSSSPQETTTGGPNPQPDPHTHEDIPPTTNHTSGLRGAFSPQEITLGGPNPQPNPHTHEGTSPAPYASPFSLRREFLRESMTLETLRAHNPATRTPCGSSHVQEPTPPRPSRFPIADAAACRTVVGITRAFDERDPRMVAARTAQAIAVAVSTSRSYTAVVSAATAAESFALLAMEDPRYQFPLPSDQLKVRYTNAIAIATNTAMAAKTGIPNDIPPFEWRVFVAFIVGSWAFVTVLWWAVKVVATLIVRYS